MIVTDEAQVHVRNANVRLLAADGTYMKKFSNEHGVVNVEAFGFRPKTVRVTHPDYEPHSAAVTDRRTHVTLRPLKPA